jgi:N-methylhydantoinase A
VRVANARMESALRRVSVERGHDPRSYALLAFGGAGPLHACALAEALRIKQVVVPASPGALSAIGILDADLRREFSRTVMAKPGSAAIDRIFGELEEEARKTFREEGLKPSLVRSADVRYQGQGFELRVDWGRNAVERFHELHARAYGYADRDRAVEIVTLRVQAVARTRRPNELPVKLSRGNADEARIGKHRMFEGGRWRDGALFDRHRLRPGSRFAGPAVVVELSATTYIPSGWTAAVDRLDNLTLSPMEKQMGGAGARKENRR